MRQSQYPQFVDEVTALILAWESMDATMELMVDDEARARVRQAEADIALGDLTTGEEMAALLESRR